MTSHTPQPPAGDELVARQVRRALLKNLPPMSSDAEYNATFNALLTGICEALTQHTEPVAGEVDRYIARANELAEDGRYPWWSRLAEILSSYDALAAKLRYVRELADSDHDELAELLKAAERQRDALREALKEIAHMDETDAALDPEWAIKRANRALKSVRALKDEGGDT